MSFTPRSLLFTPGTRPDRFAKALACEVDAVILDLEDAVAASDKAAARSHVVAFLNARSQSGPHIVVRINPLSQVSGLEDLAALAQLTSGADALLVPKAESAAQIRAVAAVLDGTGSATRLSALVESALGVAHAAKIACAHERLAFLMLGAADYAADMGQRVDTFRPDFARASIVNAAAAGGIIAIDSPFFAIDRPQQLEDECVASRALGFGGKAAIHPSQLRAINAAFSPTRAEREHALRILEAAPEGVGVLDGKMVDIAMVRWARRLA